MNKMLLITGDFWHPAGPYYSFFKKLAIDFGVELVTVVRNSMVPWEQLSEYQLVILNKEGRNSETVLEGLWLSEEQEVLLSDYVHSGGSMLGLHNGVCGYREGGAIRQLMKAHFVHHPPQHEFYLLPAEHDLMIGEPEVQVRHQVYDELYHLDLPPEVAQEHTSVFLESHSIHGREISGWTHTFGKGRFVGFTPGHSGAVLANPLVDRTLRRVVEYLLR